MQIQIEEFVSYKRIAIAGASSSKKKFGNMAGAELKTRGYEVFFVHPRAAEIDGNPAYPNITVLKDKVDTLFISVKPQYSAELLKEAAACGITKVWLQQGADSEELLELAESLRLDVIARQCILMYAPPVSSYHKVHEVFWKVIGKY